MKGSIAIPWTALVFVELIGLLPSTSIKSIKYQISGAFLISYWVIVCSITSHIVDPEKFSIYSSYKSLRLGEPLQWSDWISNSSFHNGLSIIFYSPNIPNNNTILRPVFIKPSSQGEWFCYTPCYGMTLPDMLWGILSTMINTSFRVATDGREYDSSICLPHCDDVFKVRSREPGDALNECDIIQRSQLVCNGSFRKPGTLKITKSVIQLWRCNNKRNH